MKMISVASDQITTEQQRQDQDSVFLKGDCCNNPKKSSVIISKLLNRFQLST
jgi:hypothetical protein